MTQAFNLSQFANFVNTSGQVSLSGSGVTGVLPIASGGTNNGSLAVTAGGVLYTDGSKVVNIGAGSSGQVLTSAGSGAPTWQAAAGGQRAVIFVSSGTFDATSLGATNVIVTAIGGGGGGGGYPGGAGGAGGYIIAAITGLSGSISVTVGGGGASSYSGTGSAGGTSSFGSYVTATGGQGGTTSVDGAAGTGSTTGTQIRSYNNGIVGTPFQGIYRNSANSQSAGIAWSTSSVYGAGYGGQRETANSANNSTGGIGGLVLVEY